MINVKTRLLDLNIMLGDEIKDHIGARKMRSFDDLPHASFSYFDPVTAIREQAFIYATPTTDTSQRIDLSRAASAAQTAVAIALDEHFGQDGVTDPQDQTLHGGLWQILNNTYSSGFSSYGSAQKASVSQYLNDVVVRVAINNERGFIELHSGAVPDQHTLGWLCNAHDTAADISASVSFGKDTYEMKGKVVLEQSGKLDGRKIFGPDLLARLAEEALRANPFVTAVTARVD